MRAPAKTFRDLIVWQKAHEFVLAVYPFSESFPRKEIFCLCAQFRRAAISIPAKDLGYGKTQELERKLEDVSRLLMAYANAIVDRKELNS
jgi:hypothetical protein